MGLNNSGRQPQQYTPQVQPRNGAAQGVSQASQLAQALLARQAMQQYRQKLGVPGYGVPGTQPGAVTPNALPGGAVAAPMPQPMAPGVPGPGGATSFPAPFPQANASPLMQTTPGLAPPMPGLPPP